MEICQRCNGEEAGDGNSWCEKCHQQLISFPLSTRELSTTGNKKEERNESKRD